MENLEKLVNQLREYPNETNWFEFKHNNYDPEMIGQDISALANGAAYAEKSCAYMIWGINNETHEIVGTDYDQYSLKIGNQEIENWLRQLISKNAEFEFKKITMKDKDAPPPQIEATKDYYYDIVYELPGKTAKAFTDPSDAFNAIQFNGTKENIISGVSSITNIYGGGRGGSGDNVWYTGNMLKLGTTSVTGSITIELTQNVTGVIITGYVTNNGCNIRVGDSESTIWSGGGDDGKTTMVTAKDDYFMNVTTKDIVEAGATSTIQINFESTDSITISTVKNGSSYYVLYITSIEFIVDATE